MADDTHAQEDGSVTAPISKYAKYCRKNREQRKKQCAEWWAKNGDAYRSANREILKKQAAAYRDRNRDTVRARVKAFQEDHPDKQREFERNYRARHPDRRKKSVAAYRAKPGVAEKEKSTHRQWAERNKDRLAAKAAQRRAAKLQATPSWADMDAIAAIYAEARRISRETGIPHHVDHVYPLKSDWCCGLHVETNLQILEGRKNLSKGNRRVQE